MAIQLEQVDGFLKEDERDAVRRFIGELVDPGFNAALLFHAALSARLPIVVPQLAKAINELVARTKEGTEPDGVVIAVQSFKLVTGLLYTSGDLGLPKDFLPSKDLVTRCSDEYYNLKRKL